jgi:hypothetical protein
MNIKAAIQKLAETRDEKYCKICIVDAVDETARTVDVSPIDESAPILGVNLQANQSGGVGVVCFPMVGSYVVVAFLSSATAVVVLTDEIEKIMLKIGDTTSEIIDGKITLNGGENGGLVIAEKLIDDLKKINDFIDTFKQQLTTSVPEAGNGAPSAFQQALSEALASKMLGTYSAIENKKITH